MPKSNATRNDYIKFVALGTAIPVSYGAIWYVHLHTADPGLNKPQQPAKYHTNFAREAVSKGCFRVGLFVTQTELQTPQEQLLRTQREITFPECNGVKR